MKWNAIFLRIVKRKKICNLQDDPHGQTHNPVSINQYFIFEKCLALWKVTDDMCENTVVITTVIVCPAEWIKKKICKMMLIKSGSEKRDDFALTKNEISKIPVWKLCPTLISACPSIYNEVQIREGFKFCYETWKI